MFSLLVRLGIFGRVRTSGPGENGWSEKAPFDRVGFVLTNNIKASDIFNWAAYYFVRFESGCPVRISLDRLDIGRQSDTVYLSLKHTLPSLPFNVTHLEWTNKNQSMECIEWILTCPSNLRALSLCDGSENGIGDEGCQLLDCNLMRNLTSLNLNKQSIGNRGCHIIANSSHLTNLRTLKLPSNVFDNDGLKDLLEGSIMVNLTSLDLSDSAHCTNEGFQSLITSPNITNLKSLNLSGCIVKELVFSKPLVNLEELDLGHS